MNQKIYSVDEIKRIVEPIAKAYEVENVYLFGSYARGNATPDSDVDLRVDKGKLKGLFKLGAMYSDLEEQLGKKLDLLTTGALEEEFLQRIAPEEILIYGAKIA